MNKYYRVCQRSVARLLPDPIDDALAAEGVDFLYAGSDLGSSPLCVKGSREALFLVRRILLKHPQEVLGWPADMVEELADQLGHDKGPWVRIAGVRHAVTPTERALEVLDWARVPTYFYFGATSDALFTRGPDRTKAVQVLRDAGLRGVDIEP